MKLLQKLAPALNVEVTDLLMDFSAPDKPGRVQLESMLDNGELEIWYRSKKLSEKELRRVYRVIEAALERLGADVVVEGLKIDGQAQSDQPEIQEWTKAVIEAL